MANTKGPGVGKEIVRNASLLNGWFFRDSREKKAATQ